MSNKKKKKTSRVFKPLKT